MNGTDQVISDLRKSLAWLDLALATLHEGVLVLDGNKKALFVNDAFADMVAQPRINLLGLYAWDVLSLYREGAVLKKTDYEQAWRQQNVASLGGIYELNTGSRPVSVELSVAHIVNSEHTVLVVRDVTERLQAQEQRMKIMQEQTARQAAELSERRMMVQYKVASILAGPLEQDDAICRILETVCKSLGWNIGIVWTLDDERQSLCYRLSWEGAAGSLAGFAEASRALTFAKGEGLPGRVWEKGKGIWSKDVVKGGNFPRRAVAKQLNLHGAFAVPLKSGDDFLGVMEFFGSHVMKPDAELLTSMATIGIQMAEFMRRKTIERALQQSEERLRFMADSVPHIIYTARPDGSIDYVNPQGLQYSGLSLGEIGSSGWQHVVHGDDVDQSNATWQHSLLTAQPFQIERRLRRSDGTYRWHISRAEALRSDQGDVLMWIGTDTDIEDFMRNIELEKITTSLREQRSRLLELNSAKDEFISLASHQLRTPATGVKQFLSMLIEGYGGELSDDQKLFAEKAYESNERQIAIINDLLKVAQVDAGKVILKKTKVELVGLMQNILDEQQAKFAERSQHVVYLHPDDALEAFIDAKHFRMAIENVIDNASKYTKAGKSIEVKLYKQAGSAMVDVRDEGVGIAEADTEKIFNKFIRVDNPLSVLSGGTGLGLYWCKKIIELHGGSIGVNSKVGKGTTFTIRIPLR